MVVVDKGVGDIAVEVHVDMAEHQGVGTVGGEVSDIVDVAADTEEALADQDTVVATAD